ncbi:MAG: response regulator [Methylomonas sp.]|nr:response regulator [Methylomonas sp.]
MEKQRADSATLLLVDDEPINIKVFGAFLSEYFDVLVSTSGEHALQLAKGNNKPDLILLDVMMPGMDGYQVIARLKADPDTHDIPVVFVTALSDDADEERGLKLGAVDYIYKPCNLSILLARVRIQLELQRSRVWLEDQNAFLEAELERRQQENQQVQLQLLQSEKLAAIGQLAAGVAHEINNPVGFVNSNLNTLKTYIGDLLGVLDTYQKLAGDPKQVEQARQEIQKLRQQKDIDFLCKDIPDLIDESLDGLSRVRNIVASLKDFSHVGDNKWEMADIHQGLDSTLNIIWNELKYHCTVTKDYGDLPPVYCQISQLNQVFMNLLINAAQAIKGKGEISIRTWQTGREVNIEISDTGEGVAPEHLNRLFEPFFTTKPVGKGTGLGLPISQNIAKAHGGRIEVASIVGQGTTFRVVLPIEPTSVTRENEEP